MGRGGGGGRVIPGACHTCYDSTSRYLTRKAKRRHWSSYSQVAYLQTEMEKREWRSDLGASRAYVPSELLVVVYPVDESWTSTVQRGTEMERRPRRSTRRVCDMCIQGSTARTFITACRSSSLVRASRRLDAHPVARGHTPSQAVSANY